MHGVRHVNPYLFKYLYPCKLCLSTPCCTICLLQGEFPLMVLHMFVSSFCLVMHILRGSLSLMVILLNWYVVINTKKGEIESASSPLICFGIYDNITIYF